MNISYNWLKKFVQFSQSPKEIAEILTNLGHEVEEMIPIKRHLDGVIVGKVLHSEPHPHADKLQMAQVDVGGEILPIACGAPNCRAGIVVPVALPGVKLGDFVVERRILRGVESAGIILSEKEMGLTEDHSGVLELPQNLRIGGKFDPMIEAEDTIFNLEITVNRPDALSHLGIVRELAAYFNSELSFPDYHVEEVETYTDEWIEVLIEAEKEGPRYVARIVEGVTVQPSPLWMKAMLWSLGQRPINNVVDVTNYVLLELGHPLHAFDYHLIARKKIIVRLAAEGEKFTTLDGQQRLLEKTDLLIADPEKGVALAGVMGGENSEVTKETRDILIEAAYFNPVTIRRTSKRLGLSTEASRRFERGADPSIPPIAAQRCARLIQETGGGNILHGMVDAYPQPILPWKVNLRPSRTTHVLGIEISKRRAAETLHALHLEVEEKGDDNLEVTVPTYRPDLEREIDLIEEVARIVGYSEVPTASSSRVVLDSPDSQAENLTDAVADTLSGLGFREVVTSPMVSGTDQKVFYAKIAPLEIAHPINPEMNVYRASLVPGLLRIAEHNLNHGQKDIRIFEIGQTGGRGWLAEDEGQRVHLAFLVCGNSSPQTYDRRSEVYDLFDLKGDVEALLHGISLDMNLNYSYDIQENLDHGIAFFSERVERILAGGILAERISQQFGINQPVYVLEADLQLLDNLRQQERHQPGASGSYKPFSRFPVSERDLAFIIPIDLAAREVEQRILQAAGKLLENLTLFDIYWGKSIGEGKRSLAYHLEFRSADHTLTDEEIEPIIGAIVDAVQKLGNIHLRTGQQ